MVNEEAKENINNLFLDEPSTDESPNESESINLSDIAMEKIKAAKELLDEYIISTEEFGEITLKIIEEMESGINRV